MSSGRSARLPPTPNPTTSTTTGRHIFVTSSGQNNSNNGPHHRPYNANLPTTSTSGISISRSHIGDVGEMDQQSMIGNGGITNTNNANASYSSGNYVVCYGTGDRIQSIGTATTTTTANTTTVSTMDAAIEGIPGETVMALGPELAVATSQVLENLSENERQMIIEVLNRDENVRQRDATRIMILRAELLSLRRKGILKIGNATNDNVGIDSGGDNNSDSGGNSFEATTQYRQQQHQQQQQFQQQQSNQSQYEQINLNKSNIPPPTSSQLQQQQLQQQQQVQQQQLHHQLQSTSLSSSYLKNYHPTLVHDSSRHCARCNTELGRITNRGAPCRVCKLRVCKACREFTTRTTDWVCVVCHKQMEIQAVSGDWLKDLARGTTGAVDHLPTSDVLRKTIRRSWTISNPEDDSNNSNPKNPIASDTYPPQPSLIDNQSAGSYPSLVYYQQQSQDLRQLQTANYDTGHTIIGGSGGGGVTDIGNYSASSGHISSSTNYHANLQRRILRQSTLPSSLPNNETNLSSAGHSLSEFENVNLTAPTSPHQLQKTGGPHYPSAYNSDDTVNLSTSEQHFAQQQQQQHQSHQVQQQLQETQNINPTHHRLQVRRQSTLPANPSQFATYVSNSTNRIYTRSPERSPGEQRCPTFMRQTSFPCNMSESTIGTVFSSAHHIGAHGMPMQHNQQIDQQESQQAQSQQTMRQQPYDTQIADTAQQKDEQDFSSPKPRMMRQATLPNPDHMVKLLPTSPPKRQTSPQFRRSPEFMRQQTLPNPDAFNSGNTLTVHPPGICGNQTSPSKFMPISPRHKQNFLFPNVQNPRQFLSQQNVPTVGITESTVSVVTAANGPAGEQYSSSQSVNIHHSRDHAKMIKVRSHSNEEYSITKAHPTESRRLLPEIPTSRSANRSPSRLVRQECVKDDRISGTIHESLGHSRTFGEAKQQFNQFQNFTEEEENEPEYVDYSNDSKCFHESSELQYAKNYNTGFSSEPRIIYNDGTEDNAYMRYQQQQMPIGQSADNVLSSIQDTKNNYYGGGIGGLDTCGYLASGTMPDAMEPSPRQRPQIPIHNRRRMSREDVVNLETSNVSEFTAEISLEAKSMNLPHSERRKPEQMRSVSEEGAQTSNTPKPVTRRSLSHPEKETQAQKTPETSKIPSPKPLVDLLEKSCPKITNRRRNSRGNTLPNFSDSDGKNCRAQLPELPIVKHVEKVGGTEHSSTEQVDEQKINSSTRPKPTGLADVCAMVTKETHTTTLGEQEIQNAVEAAAVVFKKVVLQRRQEKERAAEEAFVESFDIESSSDSEIKSLSSTYDHQQQYNIEADEFKLVFLNSDSSSGRDDCEDSSSTTSTHNYNSITVEDCDWDYFESAILSKPWPLPRMLRSNVKSNNFLLSPEGSPLLRRRSELRENYTAPVADEVFLMQACEQCPQSTREMAEFKERNPQQAQNSTSICNCRLSTTMGRDQNMHTTTPTSAQPIYVPIPVPLPMPMRSTSMDRVSELLPPTQSTATNDFCCVLQKLWSLARPILTEPIPSGTTNDLQTAAAAAAIVTAYLNAATHQQQEIKVFPQNHQLSGSGYCTATSSGSWETLCNDYLADVKPNITPNITANNSGMASNVTARNGHLSGNNTTILQSLSGKSYNSDSGSAATPLDDDNALSAAVTSMLVVSERSPELKRECAHTLQKKIQSIDGLNETRRIQSGNKFENVAPTSEWIKCTTPPLIEKKAIIINVSELETHPKYSCAGNATTPPSQENPQKIEFDFHTEQETYFTASKEKPTHSRMTTTITNTTINGLALSTTKPTTFANSSKHASLDHNSGFDAHEMLPTVITVKPKKRMADANDDVPCENDLESSSGNGGGNDENTTSQRRLLPSPTNVETVVSCRRYKTHNNCDKQMQARESATGAESQTLKTCLRAGVDADSDDSDDGDDKFAANESVHDKDNRKITESIYRQQQQNSTCTNIQVVGNTISNAIALVPCTETHYCVSGERTDNENCDLIQRLTERDNSIMENDANDEQPKITVPRKCSRGIQGDDDRRKQRRKRSCVRASYDFQPNLEEERLSDISNTQSTSSMSSSETADSGSDDDDDDEAKVNNAISDKNKKKKRRRFAKVFVVNHHNHHHQRTRAAMRFNSGSSGSSDSESSDPNAIDSSDNETDTERTDCGIVVLKYVRCTLDEKEEEQKEHVTVKHSDNSDSSHSMEDSDEDSDAESHSGGENVSTRKRRVSRYVAMPSHSTDGYNDNDDYDDDDDNDDQHCNNSIALRAMRTLDCEQYEHQLQQESEQQLNTNADDDADDATCCNAPVRRAPSESDASAVDPAREACNELRSIARGVNRLCALRKQHSDIEIKLQRLRRGVAEINEDHGISKTCAFEEKKRNSNSNDENYEKCVKEKNTCTSGEFVQVQCGELCTNAINSQHINYKQKEEKEDGSGSDEIGQEQKYANEQQHCHHSGSKNEHEHNRIGHNKACNADKQQQKEKKQRHGASNRPAANSRNEMTTTMTTSENSNNNIKPMSIVCIETASTAGGGSVLCETPEQIVKKPHEYEKEEADEDELSVTGKLTNDSSSTTTTTTNRNSHHHQPVSDERATSKTCSITNPQVSKECTREKLCESGDMMVNEPPQQQRYDQRQQQNIESNQQAEVACAELLQRFASELANFGCAVQNEKLNEQERLTLCNFNSIAPVGSGSGYACACCNCNRNSEKYNSKSNSEQRTTTAINEDIYWPVCENDDGTCASNDQKSQRNRENYSNSNSYSSSIGNHSSETKGKTVTTTPSNKTSETTRFTNSPSNSANGTVSATEQSNNSVCAEVGTHTTECMSKIESSGNKEEAEEKPIKTPKKVTTKEFIGEEVKKSDGAVLSLNTSENKKIEEKAYDCYDDDDDLRIAEAIVNKKDNIDNRAQKKVGVHIVTSTNLTENCQTIIVAPCKMSVNDTPALRISESPEKNNNNNSSSADNTNMLLHSTTRNSLSPKHLSLMLITKESSSDVDSNGTAAGTTRTRMETTATTITTTATASALANLRANHESDVGDVGDGDNTIWRGQLLSKTNNSGITKTRSDDDAGESIFGQTESRYHAYGRYVNANMLNNDADANEGDLERDAIESGNKFFVRPMKCTASSFEDGLADDDSWVDEISQRDENDDNDDDDDDVDDDFDDTTPTATDSEEVSVDGDGNLIVNGMYIDHEDELRGYNRSAIDFTLHTIVEESCEESEGTSLHNSEIGTLRRTTMGGMGMAAAVPRKSDEDNDILDELEWKRQRQINHQNRLSASELENYFFFGLAEGKMMSLSDMRADGDTASEISSECSEGVESLDIPSELHHNNHMGSGSSNASDLASSRLEKYFLSGFMGFNSNSSGGAGGGGGGGVGGERNESDESGGSVGSDSEGHPSPGQRRKRLVRARGTPRSTNSSQDNLLVDLQMSSSAGGGGGGTIDILDSSTTLTGGNQLDVLDSSESESGTHAGSASEKTSDGASTDTIKRKKQVRKRHDSLDEKKLHNTTNCTIVEETAKTSKVLSTPNLECRSTPPTNMISIVSVQHCKKQQHHSRDSGFVGSNDDLLKTPDGNETIIGGSGGGSGTSMSLASQPSGSKSPGMLEQIIEDKEATVFEPMTSCMHRPEMALNKKTAPDILITTPTSSVFNESTNSNVNGSSSNNKKPILASSSGLTRKDSFNNWSSDEETNLMMSKMRQFFKTLIVATANAQQNHVKTAVTSSPQQAVTTAATTALMTTPLSVRRMRKQPAQLAYFENELTRLMKTVPGINDEQVREIVEYLSSEDTWSDSYDSSDYNSSDLEGGAAGCGKCTDDLKHQISASCQQIINKFEVDEEGVRGDGGLMDETNALNPETATVYQKFVASLAKGTVENPIAIIDRASPSIVDVVPSSTKLHEQIAPEEDQISTGSTRSIDRSPQLFAKVMQHIGSRLVALMHEVSSGNDTHGANSPVMPPRHHHQHKRLQAKISVTTTEDEEDDGQLENPGGAGGHLKSTRSNTSQSMQSRTQHSMYYQLSRSHDLLLDSATSGTTTINNTTLITNNNSNTTPTIVSNVNGSGGGVLHPQHCQWSSGASDTIGEEPGVVSDYERFSWRGSFESALLANGDSTTKLSQLDRDNSSSASALAIAKRRSAGDLLFNHHKCLSREQLDRVRSCGSIGGGVDERHHELDSPSAKPWVSSSIVNSQDVRRLSVPETNYDLHSSDSDERNFNGPRSTLPRSLNSNTGQTSNTNSLPRLPTTSLAATSTPLTARSQEALNYSSSSGTMPASTAVGSGSSAKSARYRSPALATRVSSSLSAISLSSGSKKSTRSSSPGNFLYSKRDARKRLYLSPEEAKATSKEPTRSPVVSQRNESATSPSYSRSSSTGEAWPVQSDEDIDRLVAMHQNRSSMSSLGLRSDSMASVYSGAGEGRYGTVVVKGQVEFGMQYNYKLGALEIHVIRCKDLAAVDSKRNRSDPYVKVYLLPDKSKAGKRKTKVKKHTLNPIFNEVLRFHIPNSCLESRTLWLTVWHSDMFGRNDFLGEASVSLQGRVFDNPQSQWYLLQERSESFDDVDTYRGDIVVGLKYILSENAGSSKHSFLSGSSGLGSNSNLRKFGSIKSSKSDRTSRGGQLHILIKEAKHLSPIKPNGSCDAFCKSYLLPDRTRNSKQKTPVVKRSLSPSWNYTFVYEDVSLQDLSERALELTVWDHDRLASNEFLGGVRFSLGTGKSYGRSVDFMDASGKELSLWQNMLDRPNFWVEGSVVLRPSLDGLRAMP